MKIQKNYMYLLCLSVLMQSSLFAMRNTGGSVPTVPSSLMAKGFSYGIMPEGQGVEVPQATINSQAAAQVQQDLMSQQQIVAPVWTTKNIQSQLTPRQRFWNSVNRLRFNLVPEEEQVPIVPDIFKDFARKYNEHKRWLEISVEPKILTFFSPLLQKYDSAYQNFMSNPVDENVQQALIDISAHMDQFIKYFETNRPLYIQLALLPQDFINNDLNTVEIRKHGLTGNAQMEKALRDYKFRYAVRR